MGITRAEVPVWASKFLVGDSMLLGSICDYDGVISFRICVSACFIIILVLFFHVYAIILCIAWLGVVAQSKLMWFKMVLVMYHRCES